MPVAASSWRQRRAPSRGEGFSLLQAINLGVVLDPLFGHLFSGVDLSIAKGDRVALVGPNGCGKSTLLRLLMGEVRPSSGRVYATRGTHVVMLRQESLDEDVPPSHHVFRGERNKLRTDGLRSAGERMRIALASLLSQDPDILLLDEPTNHLDLPSRRWLERFLRSCPQGMLIVSHDRSFIDAVADRTIELNRGRATEYSGGYSEMLRIKGERMDADMERYERSKSEVRRLKNAAERTLQRAGQMTKLPKGVKSGGMGKPHYAALQRKLDRRAKAIKTRVAQLDSRSPDKPFAPDTIRVRFPTLPLRSAFAVQARGLSKAFGDRVLFSNLAFDAGSGERVAITGPNGAGKSTLLQGLLQPGTLDAGAVVWGGSAKPRMLSQERDFGVPDLSVLQNLAAFDQELVRTTLGCLGMRGDEPTKPLGVLSVGERSRVELASILLSGANVLLLDEPTNHLDIASLEAIEEALEAFSGTIVFVSHDQRFIETFSDRIVKLGTS